VACIILGHVLLSLDWDILAWVWNSLRNRCVSVLLSFFLDRFLKRTKPFQ
jgi:hypothetical protein